MRLLPLEKKVRYRVHKGEYSVATAIVCANYSWLSRVRNRLTITTFLLVYSICYMLLRFQSESKHHNKAAAWRVLGFTLTLND